MKQKIYNVELICGFLTSVVVVVLFAIILCVTVLIQGTIRSEPQLGRAILATVFFIIAIVGMLVSISSIYKWILNKLEKRMR